MRCSVKRGVLRNCSKFTGKHLYQSLAFNKVADCRPPSVYLRNLLDESFSSGKFPGKHHLWNHI